MKRAIPNYRLYQEKSEESEDFWLHCETLSVRSGLHNWEIAVHRHSALFQIFWVTEGRGTLVSGGGADRDFAAPCVLFIPSGAAHGFRFAEGSEGLVTTVLADRLSLPAAADRTLSAFVAETRIIPLGDAAAEEGARLDDLFWRIHAENARRDVGRDLLLDALVVEAIVWLARASRRLMPGGRGAATRDGARMQALETLIAAHFREHRPVGFYAGRVGVSVAQLNRLARREAGASVSQLVSRRLLEAARRDLIFTPTPVQAIAYSLGFQDPAYFNRFFRRQTGMTPGGYREAERRRLAA
ncbi:helix-turn-helix domain-containing protein [Nitratireductor pacificus]|uniref:AraC family transcriptional regulator n=1 Tax=Nitratireductor pacificus pht-3B TaxID=391937 RepID=K2MTP3_9HYPH|nr:helix-turn-helix domain-containing protein [Nitratireductor pacificus]EKF20742.1 AraC family transcriptional regulator [Nitratireductor pacificus pht-3B]